MPQKKDYETLIAELSKDRSVLEALLQENARAWRRILEGATDSLDYGALAYTLHNLYCLFENYFLRIAKFFENALDPETWHRDLVRRMALEIRGVRPAFMDDGLAHDIDELRGFRHVFRNLYQTSLDPQRIQALQARLKSTVDRFAEAHQRFIEKIRAVADQV
jgi:hypothetical protein